MIKENKVSKYMLYAIGEIVLVVIGILIALSINNWNESKKLKDNEIQLVKQLLIDANADSIFFQDRYTALKGQYTIYENIKLLCTNSLSDKVIKRTIPKRSQPFITLANQSNFVFNNPNAYDQLSNKSIKLQLQQYISKYEFVNKSIEIFNHKIEDYFSSIRINYYKEIPQLFETSSISDFKFLCESENNLGVIKLIQDYSKNAETHTVNFLENNATFINSLTRYLEKKND
ncbi:hypothetical protein JYT76_01190 [Olleya sp. AH-315-F22]|nr:hypothetical protein [Olleya sp. AH-315-F22]